MSSTYSTRNTTTFPSLFLYTQCSSGLVTKNLPTGWNLNNRLPSRRLNVVHLQRTLTPEGFSGEEPPKLKSVYIQSILKSKQWNDRTLFSIFLPFSPKFLFMTLLSSFFISDSATSSTSSDSVQILPSALEVVPLSILRPGETVSTRVFTARTASPNSGDTMDNIPLRRCRPALGELDESERDESVSPPSTIPPLSAQPSTPASPPKKKSTQATSKISSLSSDWVSGSKIGRPKKSGAAGGSTSGRAEASTTSSGSRSGPLQRSPPRQSPVAPPPPSKQHQPEEPPRQPEQPEKQPPPPPKQPGQTSQNPQPKSFSSSATKSSTSSKVDDRQKGVDHQHTSDDRRKTTDRQHQVGDRSQRTDDRQKVDNRQKTDRRAPPLKDSAPSKTLDKSSEVHSSSKTLASEKPPLDQQSFKTQSASSTKALVESGDKVDTVLGKRSRIDQGAVVWKRGRDSHLPPDPLAPKSTSLLLASPNEVAERLEGAQAEQKAEFDVKLRSLDEELSNKNKALVERDAALAAKEVAAAEKEAALKEKEGALEQEKAARAQAEVARVQAENARAQAEAARAELEATLAKERAAQAAEKQRYANATALRARQMLWATTTGQLFLREHRAQVVADFMQSPQFLKEVQDFGVDCFQFALQKAGEQIAEDDFEQLDPGAIWDALPKVPSNFRGDPNLPLEHEWWSGELERTLGRSDILKKTFALPDDATPPTAMLVAMAESIRQRPLNEACDSTSGTGPQLDPNASSSNADSAAVLPPP
ncbi:Unknown protein, partial [Striga hermonthica]